MLKKAKQDSINGKKISILLEDRNILQLRLDELNNTRYYKEADIKLHYINSGGTTSTDTSNYIMRNILYSTDLQILGKEIVDKINDLEKKLIGDLVSLAKSQLEIRIQLIDKLLESLVYVEKSNSHSG